MEKDLLRSFNGDMGCREEMHYGQCLAGMAFSNALLGIVHSMAHKTGAAFSGGHIVHGCANAMYLPKVIRYNAKNPEAAERYAQIAKFLHLSGSNTEELVTSLIEELKKMNKALEIPSCIKDYEGGIIDENEFMEKLPQVAELITTWRSISKIDHKQKAAPHFAALLQDCRKTYITKRVIRPTPINPQKPRPVRGFLSKGGAPRWQTFFARVSTTGQGKERNGSSVTLGGSPPAPCKNSKKWPKPLFRHAQAAPHFAALFFFACYRLQQDVFQIHFALVPLCKSVVSSNFSKEYRKTRLCIPAGFPLPNRRKMIPVF